MTVPAGRSRQTSLRPNSSHGGGVAPFRASVWHSSKWMWTGWSQPPPPLTRCQISAVPGLGAAEMRFTSNPSPPPLFTLMVQGLSSVPPDRPNSKVRSRTTGLRSGSGIMTAGTWLTSRLAGSRATRNSRIRPTTGSFDFPARASARESVFEGFFPSWCSRRFVRWTFSPIRYFEKSTTTS